MKNYNCEYQSGKEQGLKRWKAKIRADSPRKAYEIFLRKIGFAELTVIVKTGFFRYEYFNDHSTKEALENRRKERAIIWCEFLNQKKHDGYFLLESIDKIKAQKFLEEMIFYSEKGPLFREEVKYIERWLSFKHRELGQSLLSQSEAKKPDTERGQSELGQALTSGIIAGNIAKANQIRELKELNESVDEIADDVSGGYEG